MALEPASELSLREFVRVLFSERDLLRFYPTLWAYQLHRLPGLLAWWWLASGVFIGAVWFLTTMLSTDALSLILGLAGFTYCMAAVGVAWSAVAYFGSLPENEAVAVSRSVHRRAFALRFAVISLALQAPLVVVQAGLAIIGHAVPTGEIVRDMNSINVGAQACCALDPASPGCLSRKRLPRSRREEVELAAAGYPLVNPALASAQAQACMAMDGCAGVIREMADAIVKHQDLGQRNPLGKYPQQLSTRQLDDEAQVPGERSHKNPRFVCASLIPQHFVEADANTNSNLTLSGRFNWRAEPTPLTLYLDPFLLAAWIALIGGMRLAEGAGGAVMAILATYFLTGLALVITLAQFDWWPVDGAMLFYYRYLTVAVLLTFPVAVVRLVTRPREETRLTSLHYTMALPLFLSLFPPVIDFFHTTALGLNGLGWRLLSFVLFVCFVHFFDILKRQGEMMRALPRIEVSPESAGT